MKKKIIFASIILITTIIAILLFINMANYAAEISRGIFQVVNTGEDNLDKNPSVEITQKIVEANKENVTIEVALNNLKYEETEIALVVENSISMWADNKILDIKNSIKEFVNNCFDEANMNSSKNIKMSLSTYDGIIVEMGEEKDAILNAIDNITEYEGILNITGVQFGQDSFLENATTKTIVLITNGEDTPILTNKLEEVKEEKINLYTILMGTSKTKYSSYGIVYEVYNAKEDFESTIAYVQSGIRENMKKELREIAVEIAFNEELLKNTTFKIIESANNQIIEKTETGFNWAIGDLLGTNETAKFQYQLNIKNTIDKTLLEKELNVINTTKVTYKDLEEPYEITSSPVVKIKECYAIELQAINKKFDQLNVKGAEYKIIQKNLLGELIREETLQTDEDGKILFNYITEKTETVFEITENSLPKPYKLNEDAKISKISIKVDEISNLLTVIEENTTIIETNIKLEQDSRTIKIKKYLDQYVFIMNIKKVDSVNEQPLKGAKFVVNEPECRSIPSNITTEGISREDGTLKLTIEEGDVTDLQRQRNCSFVCYTLNETEAPIGYKTNMAQHYYFKFSQTGEIEKVYKSDALYTNDDDILAHSTNLLESVENDTLNVTITNELMNYTLKVTVLNNEYNEITVQNAKLQILALDEQKEEKYNQELTTNEQGMANMKITEKGMLLFTIKQNDLPGGYGKTGDVNFAVTREFATNELVLNQDGVSTDSKGDIIAVPVNIDNENKIVSLTIFAIQKKFTMNINKIDGMNQKALEEVKIQLIQPNGRRVLEGSTTAEGIITFECDIVYPNNGSGQSLYKLIETESAAGYEKIEDPIELIINFEKDKNDNISEVIKTSEYITEKSHEKGDTVDLELKNYPIGFKIEIVALNKAYGNVPIEGLKLNLKAQDGEGTFYNNKESEEELITDENGKIALYNIRQSGDIDIEIEQESVACTYILGDKKTVSITRELETQIITSRMEGTDEYLDIDVEQPKSLIIYLYLNPKTFEIEISKKDLNLANVLIKGAEFSLTQPAFRTAPRDIITGITVKNEKLLILGEVAGEGTYTYLLEETKVPYGYRNNSLKIELEITFNNNGLITNVTKKETSQETPEFEELTQSYDYIYSSNNIEEFAQIENYSTEKIPITILNDSKGIKFSLKVKKNTEWTYYIPNYEFNVNILDQSNNSIYNKNLKTSSEGLIEVDGFSKAGNLTIKLTPVSTFAEYYNFETKTIKINKTIGTNDISIDSYEDDHLITSLSQEKTVLEAIILVDIKKFEFEISSIDSKLEGALIEGAEYIILQPNFEDKSRQVLKGVTIEDEKLVLEGEVAGKGIFEYTIKQEEPVNGYKDLKINATLEVEFDDEGKIIAVQKKENAETIACDSKVLIDKYESEKIELTIFNDQKPYVIKIEAYNAKYKNVALNKKEDALVPNVEFFVIGVNSNDEIIYNTEESSKIIRTNEEGFVLTDELEETGDITYYITQTYVPADKFILNNKQEFIKMNKDLETTQITINEATSATNVNNETKEITITIYIEPAVKVKILALSDFDEKPVPNVTVEVTVSLGEKTEEEKIEYTRVYRETCITDENGCIEIGTYEHLGFIQVVISKEKSVPLNFTKYVAKRTVTIYHDFEKLELEKEKTSKKVDVRFDEIDFDNIKNEPEHTADILLYENQKVFDIFVTKKDAENESIFLPGATVKLTRPDGATEEKTSDEYGMIKFLGAMPKEAGLYEYKLKEIAAPIGYSKSEIEAKILVKIDSNLKLRLETEILVGNSYLRMDEVNIADKCLRISMFNSKEGETCNVQIIKTCMGQRVENDKYDIKLQSTDGHKAFITDKTDERGTIYINNLNATGEIELKIKEIEAPVGYKLDTEEKIATFTINKETLEAEVVESKISEKVRVTIDENTIIIVIEGEKAKNKITVETIDASNEEIKIGNIGFKLQTPNDTNLYKTNDKGKKDIDVVAPGVGEFEYKIQIEENSMLAGYNEILDIFAVYITFDEKDKISSVRTTGSNDVIVAYNDFDEESGYNIARIIIKFTPIEQFFISIEKQDENDSFKSLQNAKYDIITITDGEIITYRTETTDEYGYINTTAPAGDRVEFYYTEVIPPEGYALDDTEKKIVIDRYSSGNIYITEKSDENIEVQTSGKATINIIDKNRLKKEAVCIELVKQDKYNQEIKLEGVVLKIKDLTTNQEHELITDEAGQTSIKDIIIEEPGEYEFLLQEIQTLEGYKIPQVSEEIKFIVSYELDEEGDLVLLNAIQKGGEEIINGFSFTEYTGLKENIVYLKCVIKNEIDTNAKHTINLYTKGENELAIPYAEYDVKISKENGKSIRAIMKSDENGEVLIEAPILEGDTTIEFQQIAIPYGYELDTSIRKIVLNKENDIVTIKNTENMNNVNTQINNENIDIYVTGSESPDVDQAYSILIQKTNKQWQGIGMPGSQYLVLIRKDESAPEIASTSMQVKAGESEETPLQTGTNGDIYIPDIKGYGNYNIEIKEISATTGYLLDEETKIITIERSKDSINLLSTNGSGVKAEVDNITKVIKVKIISKSANQTTGTLKLKVENMNDKEVEINDNATIRIFNKQEIDWTNLTTDTRENLIEIEKFEVNGQTDIDIEIGEYDILIDKVGYLDYIITDVIVEENIETNLGTVELYGGDTNKNGEIYLEDLVNTKIHYESQIGEENYDERCDLNKNGEIYLEDLIIIKMNYEKTKTIRKYEK